MTVSSAPLPSAFGSVAAESEEPPYLAPPGADGPGVSDGLPAPPVLPKPAGPSPSRQPQPAGKGGGAPRRGRDPGRLGPAGVPGPRPPVIQRPTGLVAPSRPADIQEPEHRHLPGWVRRAHGQARPILADLLGSLEGEPRQRYDAQVRQLIEGISAGRFSLAWQYPQLIDEGWALLERSRRDAEAEARRRRGVETARRRMVDQLRDAGDRLNPETASRLHRTLRSAESVESIKGVGTELDQVLSTARSVEERRRDREIDRTRERLRRSLPQGSGDGQQAESWQDALRRIADQYSAR